MSVVQEITSRNRFFVSEVDGNDAAFGRIAVLGFSFDESWGSVITFLEKAGVWKKTSGRHSTAVAWGDQGESNVHLDYQ